MNHLERHTRLFNLIATPYRLFFNWQKKGYSDHLLRFGPMIPIIQGASVLDVGCGTGPFTAALRESGYNAEGVDIAPRMVSQGKKADLECRQGDITKGLPFEDKSFDFTTAAFVAHGLTKPLRLQMYKEMARISRKGILLHEFSRNTNPLIMLVETIEGGDYFYFRKHAEAELSSLFGSLRIIPVGTHNAWYIMNPDSFIDTYS